eukprot:CAMPEP_0206326856 /NCGR_PEP_ID=MMETSP0106_2-20121207/21840_1 /ASSEMBLY_ACC=CAM_ASM_000206 /TAXON_ID=81532 /ORGANISM="Acanthoeca-like sp., Strain 10tr" /LENGTH=254 /DNA_ID=CAMNT_0053759439 /DNA_START=160 /DNA_END=925 /DNA_ORIENTATION=-
MAGETPLRALPYLMCCQPGLDRLTCNPHQPHVETARPPPRPAPVCPKRATSPMSVPSLCRPPGCRVPIGADMTRPDPTLPSGPIAGLPPRVLRSRPDGPRGGQALRAAKIPAGQLAAALPRELSVWCDPGAVTTRLGSGELLMARVGSTQWTPPASPALSAAAPEFKPSPPSSPNNQLSRRSAAPAPPPGLGASDVLSPRGGGRHSGYHYPGTEAMTPPFAPRYSGANFYGGRQHHAAPPANVLRPSVKAVGWP